MTTAKGRRADRSPCSVLVVDDDLETREVMRLTLEDLLEPCLGRVLTASNGREAIDLLSVERPCVVLLDLMMPVMSGAEFLYAREKDPVLRSVPVVVLSAWPREKEHLPGVEAFVGKPIDVDRLLEVVHRYCAEKTAARASEPPGPVEPPEPAEPTSP